MLFLIDCSDGSLLDVVLHQSKVIFVTKKNTICQEAIALFRETKATITLHCFLCHILEGVGSRE
jgi:hypothetical protein